MSRHHARWILLTLMLGALCRPASAEDRTGSDSYPEVRTTIDGADEFLNIEYLPAWRYSGDKSKRRDWEMTLDLWVPKGKTNCPLVVYVHGGAYSEGTKNLNAGYKALGERLIARGIAFGSLNYILKPRRIRPQVWYDYRDAARYLRMNAEKYRLDPTAFGAYGMSAGGWLITNAGHGTGDVFSSEANASGATIQELVRGDFVLHPPGVWAPLQNDNRGWPDHYGRWQAIAFDFSHLNRIANSWSPAMCDVIGAGLPEKMRKDERYRSATFWKRADTGVFDLAYAEMLAPKYVGQSVHVPPLDFAPGQSKKARHEHAITRHVVGEGEALLVDVLARWFEDRLRGPNARAPVPEIWPGLRIVDGPVEVSMIAPEGVTIHYTRDGSDPTPSSPRYAKPFTVEPATVVKAIGVQAGKKPSGAMVATFVKGPIPPKLNDYKRDLPPAETGKPYRHVFNSSEHGAHFYLKGDLVPYTSRHAGVVFPNGMSLDPLTGVWSGTPTKPGRYWVQVAVNRGPGTVCRVYDHIWMVTGKDLAGEDATPEAGTDTHAVILRFDDGLHKGTRRHLEHMARQRKIDLVIEGDGPGLVLLAPDGQKDYAKRFLIEYFTGKRPLPDGARWEK